MLGLSLRAISTTTEEKNRVTSLSGNYDHRPSQVMASQLLMKECRFDTYLSVHIRKWFDAMCEEPFDAVAKVVVCV